ncbi:permease prefix domain 2-containing transporter [Spirosoma soli]|uniref:Permease prefix domain 2-containing transporter n=1 Tax=Spirosoma soli TaxID=1770529 RepID=A0ABW5M8N8_9BACT
MNFQPPRLADRLLEWFVAPHRLETLQGDLHEEFAYQVGRIGKRQARWRYWRDVLGFIRPYVIKREESTYSNPALTTMLRNYFKIAYRNLVKNKVYSFINIAGLAAGMAVAMLIGLWIHDELSFNKYHQNYDRIVQVMQHQTFNGEVGTQRANPYPLGPELWSKYGSDGQAAGEGLFKYVVMSSWTNDHVLAYGNKKITKTGNFFEAQAPDMLTLHMRKGTRAGLKEINSIMLSESVANAFFGDTDPIGQLMKIDSKFDVKVTGVYEDLPYNSDFKELTFMAPWALFFNSTSWPEKLNNPWRANAFQTFAQLADHVGVQPDDIDKLSAQIKDVKLNRVNPAEARFKPEVFLHPMSQWHLYSEWKNGVNTGGRIQFVWLFGIIGVFVLLLACINFMNLSTARSEKRAKEVGIRKAVGSVRSQLIAQFFSESLLVVAVAFAVALLLVQFSLPVFNEVADKKLTILWSNPLFWGLGLSFSLLTGLIASSYPALYLSSFQPVKVLKGTFKVGRFAAIPRQVLVVVQFTVSVTLIIGTIIVFRQIQYAKDRPIGYSRDGLLTVPMTTPDMASHYNAIRSDVLRTGAVADMSESSNPPTYVAAVNNGYEWKGKDPSTEGNFATVSVSHDFGKSVGWQFKQGRDFSRAFSTDSSGIVLNETAVKFMGLKQPIGETVTCDGKPYTVVGVIKDMVMESPYQPVFRTVFMLDYGDANVFNIKLNPALSAREALSRIEPVFKKYSPSAPFDYKFVDEAYARKFGDEERIGRLSSFFAILAIFISCLGIFGLASFIAEQRTKEIGVRKVLGASVVNLWGLLSKDFVVLVVIAFFVATPLAYYALNSWLQKYEYRTEISWWIFAVSGAGALVVTLLTVSYQSIKAALMNPVKSLRSE